MNIFLTDKDPKIAASHLDDLRLNKMILETAQLLSGAYPSLFKDNWSQDNYGKLYKKTHINHPCAIWARKSIDNFRWLTQYFYELSNEKYKRTNKKHASFEKLFPLFEISCVHLPTDFSNVIFDFNCTDYKSIEVTLAYRKQLCDKWNKDKRQPTWINTTPPEFYFSGWVDKKVMSL